MLIGDSGHGVVTRRSFLILATQAVVAIGLGGRLYHLQISQGHSYRTLSEKNQLSLRPVLARRGAIYDRNGIVLAHHIDNYQLTLYPDRLAQHEATLAQLSRLLRLDENHLRQHIASKQPYRPITLKQRLSWQDVATLEAHATSIPNAHIEKWESRFYPYGDKTCHVIGYMGAPTRQELQNHLALRLPHARVGKTAIEKAENARLSGTSGLDFDEVNAQGVIARRIKHKPAHNGQNLTITIDYRLQSLAMERLQGLNGSAVLLDCQNGDILALASSPSFDANMLSFETPKHHWQALHQNPHKPLINKAISALYAPGSTFKLITALASLEAQQITPEDTIVCRGHKTVGDATFHCWKNKGHGAMTLKHALAESCDVYFYTLAERLSIAALARMARLFGLGQSYNLPLPNQKIGIIPDADWKKQQVKEKWFLGDTIVASIGQGYTTTSCLQLAVMTARIAQKGRAVVPRLISHFWQQDNGRTSKTLTTRAPLVSSPDFMPLPIQQDNLMTIHDAMDAVVNESYGTAYHARIRRKGAEMSGKSGSTQIRRISADERLYGVIKNSDLPWYQRDHGLFVGYAPRQHPRYATAVIIEHSGSGARHAAPIAAALLEQAQMFQQQKI